MPEYGLQQLVELLKLEVMVDGDVRIRGVATLEEAGPEQMVYAESERLLPQVQATRAAAVLVPPGFPEVPGRWLLRVENPRLVFLRVAELFVEFPGCDGIHPDASIHPDAELGEGISVAACAVVSRGARIGAGSCIGAGAFVGEGVEIGADCRIEANASLSPGVTLGDRVIIRTNTSIGGQGFGFTWLEDHHHPVPQLGRVEIDDDTEIGCNSSVDRATLGVTRIGRGTKIDNQVHIAHNCEIGEHVILAGQTGLSGSVTVRRGAVLAGQVGVSDHIDVGAGATVGGKSAVTKDIAPGEFVWGSPAREMKRVIKEQAALARLPELLKQFKAMQKELQALRQRVAELEEGRKEDGPNDAIK